MLAELRRIRTGEIELANSTTEDYLTGFFLRRCDLERHRRRLVDMSCRDCLKTLDRYRENCGCGKTDAESRQVHRPDRR